MVLDTSNITKLKIDDNEVFLEELGPNQGKIILSDSYGHNYSYYWGAMGGTLKDFILHINEDYFAKNLGNKMRVFNPVKTFSNVRKYIREDMGYPYYWEMEFQKDMREKLKEFQSEVEDWGGKYTFVDRFFPSFVERLNYSLIKNDFDRKQFENEINNITEPWHFIEEKQSDEYIWLCKFHKKLKKELKKLK